MNKLIILITMVWVLYSQSVMPATNIGSAFSYQGELIESGTPANGTYDMIFSLVTNQSGNSTIMGVDNVPNVDVVNGLFSIESVDFGDAVYEASLQLYIEVSVKLSSSSSYEVLSPRIRLSAVPHAVQAEYLAKGNATNGDILHLENDQWVATSEPVNSPWNIIGTALMSPGVVGVGQQIPLAQLHVTNNSIQADLIRADDVGQATRFLLESSGKLGLGTFDPSDRLHINSNVGEDALRVQVDGQTKLRVRENGGVTVGANSSSVPNNGLYIKGNVIQDETSNGMMKYMAALNCGDTNVVSRFYNGTNIAGNVTVLPNLVFETCQISFPTDVSTRYFVATALTTSGESRVGCNYTVGNVNDITCKRFKNGVVDPGPMTILVY